MEMYKVIILADSRGRDLENRLNRYNSDVQFHVEVHPGANMKQLIKRIQTLPRTKGKPAYQLVIIHGGLCNITKIEYMPYRAAVLQMDTVGELLDKFKNDCENQIVINANIPVLFSPVVGIDLVRYAGHWNESLFKMQPVIDEVITEINTYIRTFNCERGLPTPNTSSCIHRCRGKDKGYRTHYQKLYDGCHPSDEIKEIWAKAFFDCCQLVFK